MTVRWKGGDLRVSQWYYCQHFKYFNIHLLYLLLLLYLQIVLSVDRSWSRPSGNTAFLHLLRLLPGSEYQGLLRPCPFRSKLAFPVRLLSLGGLRAQTFLRRLSFTSDLAVWTARAHGDGKNHTFLAFEWALLAGQTPMAQLPYNAIGMDAWVRPVVYSC